MHEECLRRCVWTTVRVPRDSGRSARRRINDHLVNKYRSDRRRCQVTGCVRGVFICESHYQLGDVQDGGAERLFRVGGIAPGPGVCDTGGNNTEQMVSKWMPSGQWSYDGRTDEEVGSR